MSTRLSKAQSIAPGAALAGSTGRDNTGAVEVNTLPQRRAVDDFGFIHLGAAGGGADQFVWIGDGEGIMAAGLSKTATAFGTPIGCGSNVNTNKHLKHYPVVIEKVTIESTSATQLAKEILYAVVSLDGEIDKVSLSKKFQADKSRSDFQTSIAIARFRTGMRLGACEGIVFTVGDTLTMQAMLSPIAERA